MATSKCGFCNSTRFEVKTIDPNGSNFKMLATQCAACGSVLGVTEYYNIGSLLQKLAKKLGHSLTP